MNARMLLVLMCCVVGTMALVVLPDVCKLHMAKGNCKGKVNWWYYNIKSSKCESFSYTGCGGNDNRFKTKQLCEAKCMAKG